MEDFPTGHSDNSPWCVLTPCSLILAEALKISPVCPTAYFSLASIQPTYEKALEYYSIGADQGVHVVGEKEWNKLVEEGHLWLSIATRFVERVLRVKVKIVEWEVVRGVGVRGEGVRVEVN